MKVHLLLSLFLLPVSAVAQWEVRMSGLPQSYTFQAVTVTSPGPAWVGSGGNLWKSTDMGQNWTPVAILPQYGNPLVLSAVNAGTLIYCTASGKIVRTTDGGSTWTKVFEDSAVTGFFNDLEMLDSLQGYAIGDPPDGSRGPGLVTTTDGGASWKSVSNNLPKGDMQTRFRTDFTSPSKGWTKVYNDGIFHTTDGGQNWQRIYTGLEATNLFFVSDSVGFYSSYTPPMAGLFKTTDGGVTWKQTFSGAPFEWVRWAPGGKILWAARETLYVSADIGESWKAVLSNRDLGGNGTFQDACFLKDDTGLVVGMGLVIGQSPDPVFVRFAQQGGLQNFELQQNYPNPFNPSTMIRYGLPHKSHVSLTVYNTLGQKVATLVEGEREAGFHEVGFDATNFSSGVYLYRLTAGSFVQTRKLLSVR